MTGHAQWVDRSCISGKIEATEVKVGVNTNKATDNRSHNQADEVVSQIHRCLPHTAGDSLKRAEILNRHCSCRTLDPERLRRQLEGDPTLSSLYGEILTKRPHLFSATAVFITPEQQNTMATIISAVESVVKRPTYQKEILARAHWAGQSLGLHSVPPGYLSTLFWSICHHDKLLYCHIRLRV